MRTAPAKARGAKARPIEILLVEDNPGDVLLAREAFRRSDLANHLRVAADGEEALAMLRREGVFKDQARPDLVLLDLNLPGLSGEEVLASIRRDPVLKHVPVMILSGVQAEAGGAPQADAHIVKPSDFEGLRHVIADIERFWSALMSLPGVGRL